MHRRIQPGPGQESVWDYPRPPRVERAGKRIQVFFGGKLIVDTTEALRVLETSHPPTYYVPIEAIQDVSLVPDAGHSVCEFKGVAQYFTLQTSEREAVRAAWSYPQPLAGYDALRGHIALYPSRMERCLVDNEVVQSQDGDFYGGWITQDLVGPFKGGPGTRGW